MPENTTSNPVAVDTSDGIATLTLKRPDARNALSEAMLAALQEALDRISQDPEISVVVIAADGPAFCAGHDLKEMRATPERTFYERLFRTCSRVMTTIVRLRQPVIASVQGPASAAGCQLVASCDLALASLNARFATPGVDIGLFCSTPMVALSRNVGRKAAMEMLLTGDLIDASEAVRIGLVNRVVPPEDLAAETLALARRIASKSPRVLAIGKEAFYRQIEMPLDKAYAYTSEVMTLNMMRREAEEGIDAFIEKREPVWPSE